MESHESRETPSLLVLAPDGRECQYVLELSDVVIGREAACTIPLQVRGVSRRHARIRIEAGRATLEDLGSTNGTWLNGRLLTSESASLSDGDRINISLVEIHYLDPDSRKAEGGGDHEESATELETAFTTTGRLGSTLAQDPSLLDSPEAEVSVLRMVLSRPTVAHLVIREAGVSREVRLEERRARIGRGPDCDIRLADRRVSSQHATIRTTASGHIIEDLGSRGGIRVNGIPVREHRLGEGDLVRIGETALVYAAPFTESPPPTMVDRAPVVVIPGFAASELWKGDGKIWPNHTRMLSTPWPQMLRDWENVAVGRIVREVSILPGVAKYDSFGSLIRFLQVELGYESDRDLLEFPYDWRQDNHTTARDLAIAIRAWRKRRDRPTEKPVIIAHSMGGLVARLYISAYGGADAVRRCIFLGTPHQGTARSFQLAVSGAGFLPFGIRLRKVRKLVKGFPSQYQLFPSYPVAEFLDGRPFRIFEEDHDWLAPVYRPFLERAAAFRKLIDARPVHELVPCTCIFGYQQKTLSRIRLDRDLSGRLHVDSEHYDKIGDGTVTETSAVLEGADIHPVHQQHSVLHSSADVLRRLRFELTERT